MECGCCKYLAAVLIVAAAGLSLVALITSHWSEYSQDKDTDDPLLEGYTKEIETYKGLWKACYTEENRATECINIGHTFGNIIPAWWRIVQSMEILSVIFGVIAILLWGCCFTCSKEGSSKSIACSKIFTCLFSILAAICHGVAVVFWIIKEKDIKDKYQNYNYGWSLWAAVAGGCTSILATVVSLISQPPTYFEEAPLY